MAQVSDPGCLALAQFGHQVGQIKILGLKQNGLFRDVASQQQVASPQIVQHWPEVVGIAVDQVGAALVAVPANVGAVS